jgi:hypothetical protein
MSNNKQRTAVEWYAIEMYEYFRSMFGSGIINTDILEKAKEMEKERMIDFAYKALMEADSTVNRFVDVDELYNETYGGGNK